MRHRSLLGLSALLLSLGLAACEQSETPATTTPTEAAAPMPPPVPARAGRTVSTPAPTRAAGRAAAEAPAASSSGHVSQAALRGERVTEVNQMLTGRGYQRIRSAGGTTYWKNTRTDRCLRVSSASGRVTTVSNANASHCRR